jgi:hypothetical protein
MAEHDRERLTEGYELEADEVAASAAVEGYAVVVEDVLIGLVPDALGVD